MGRRDRTVSPEDYKVKRPKFNTPNLSPVEAMEKRIETAVREVHPADLRLALSIRTRQSNKLEFGIFQQQRLFMSLCLPDNYKYVFMCEELKECIRILKEHFRLPSDAFYKIVRGRRQFDDLTAVLFEGSEMKAVDLERVAYTAMVYQRDRTLQAIIKHPNFNINQTPTFLPPFLAHKLLHYALKENGPVTQLVDVVLAHPDIDPGTRSTVGNVWATALGTAHKAYKSATGAVEAKRAVRHVRTLLGRDDVDMHTMDDDRTSNVEVFFIVFVPKLRYFIGVRYSRHSGRR